MRKTRSLPPLGWILIGLGLFLVSGSYVFRFARDEWIRIAQSKQVLAQVQGMMHSTAAERNAMKSMAVGEAISPHQLVKDTTTKGAVTVGRPVVWELSDGIRHQQVTLEIKDVEPESVLEWLRVFENAQPSWRVTRVELETYEGTLRGALRLEALDKPASIP